MSQPLLSDADRSVIVAYLAPWADTAERDLRSLHPEASLSGDLPAHIEAELATVSREDPTSLLRHYQRCRTLLTNGTVQATATSTDQDPAEIAYELITRAPEMVPLSNGRTVPVRSKSVNTYARFAAYWDLYVLYKEVEEKLSAQRRFSNLLHLWFARRLANKLLLQILAMALHDGPSVPPGTKPPAYVDELTHADAMAIQLAQMRVGPGRFQVLPEPPSDDNRKRPERDVARTGFAFFFAAIAKHMKRQFNELMDEDYWKILAELNAAAETPPPDAGEALEGM